MVILTIFTHTDIIIILTHTDIIIILTQSILTNKKTLLNIVVFFVTSSIDKI